MKGSSMVQTRNDGHNQKLQIPIQPNIGLERDARQAVVEILNITLADEAVLKTKTRCAHWNVQGANFYVLHSLFKDQYEQLNATSDEIGERIRMLGGYAVSSLEDFLENTRLEEHPGLVPDVLGLLANHESLIRFLRVDARKSTEEYEDEGTFKLLVRVMSVHEKMAWMLRSCIGTESPIGKSENRLITSE
jgi:starvation-inducible DNA-binding protein